MTVAWLLSAFSVWLILRRLSALKYSQKPPTLLTANAQPKATGDVLVTSAKSPCDIPSPTMKLFLIRHGETVDNVAQV